MMNIQLSKSVTKEITLMTDKKNNSNLGKARKVKQDEFYTQLTDIEKELKHYKPHFKGKTVYCNCDDPFKSGFFKYFFLNFDILGLKKLITTCYSSQDINNQSKNDSKQAMYIEYVSTKTNIKELELKEIKPIKLKGDGDFRSDECIELLKQADIVVTNPPFSLFREYVAQLIEYDKKFLIIGSLNAITYKDIFTFIKDNKLWQGYGNGAMTFKVPDSYTGTCNGDNGQKQASLGNICWYTNLNTTKRHEDIIMYKEYSPEAYPKYDNFDAINVNKLNEIPMDYYGKMGVPITFLDKYNPKQFDIIGNFHAGSSGSDLGATKTETITNGKTIMWNGAVINKKPLYARIIIQRKKQ